MEPKQTHRWNAEPSTEDELFGDEFLAEDEAEDLLGHAIDFDEADDWRALDF